jgi:hypothetical protein
LFSPNSDTGYGVHRFNGRHNESRKSTQNHEIVCLASRGLSEKSPHKLLDSENLNIHSVPFVQVPQGVQHETHFTVSRPAVHSSPLNAIQRFLVILGQFALAEGKKGGQYYTPGKPNLLSNFGVRLGDAGLESISTLKNLKRLGLRRTQITGAGLEHLKDMTNLTTLAFDDTQVTDTGMKHLNTRQ